MTIEKLNELDENIGEVFDMLDKAAGTYDETTIDGKIAAYEEAINFMRGMSEALECGVKYLQTSGEVPSIKKLQSYMTNTNIKLADG